MEEIYPYSKDPHEHEHAHLFYNVPGLGLGFDAANIAATHIFDHLGCGAPGTTHEPAIKYDALGTGGGPWQPGEWIPIEQPRKQVVATAPDIKVSDMTAEQLAELKAAIAAVETAQAAGTISHSDEKEVT